MWFLIFGLLGVALKYFGIAPVATWSWWLVLTPFPLAIAWWAFADASGYTKRQVVAKQARRKQARIDKQRDYLNVPPRAGQPRARVKR